MKTLQNWKIVQKAMWKYGKWLQCAWFLIHLTSQNKVLRFKMETTFDSRLDKNVFYFLSEDLKTKTFIIVFTLFLTAISCLMSFGVIWYDHNCNDKYRTLIHRGATLIAWFGLIGVPIMEIFDVLQSTLGTFPKQLCLCGLIFKNMIKTFRRSTNAPTLLTNKMLWLFKTFRFHINCCIVIICLQ